MNEKGVCGLCKQTVKEPRLLSCLHSFCTECLITQKAYRSATSSRQASQDDTGSLFSPELSENASVTEQISRIICTVCSTETVLTNGIHGLPLNYRLQSRLGFQTGDSPGCDLCSSTKAYRSCEQCGIALCALCTDSHIKFGETAHHNVLPIEETLSEKNEPPSCRDHSLDLSHFCFSCSQLVCFTCCATTHFGHKNLETAVRAAQGASASLKRSLEQAKPAVRELQKRSDALKTLQNRIMTRCVEVERDMMEFLLEYRTALEEHGQGLLQEVENIKQSRLQQLETCCQSLESGLKKMQTAIEFTEELLSDSSPVEVLSVACLLFNKFETPVCPVSDVESSLTKGTDFLQFLPEEKCVSSTPRPFQLFGIISTRSVEPENCTLNIEGLFTCRQHKRASFTLYTRDSDNRPLCHGGEKIEVVLRYKDATQRVVPVSVNDRGEGTYVLSFVPDTSGSLSLTIKIRNQHIQGSPFSVCVTSIRPHKGVFHCCAFCSSGGSKSATCGCGSQMPGGYKGCGHGHNGHPGRRHWSCCGNVLQNSECGRSPSFYSF